MPKIKTQSIETLNNRTDNNQPIPKNKHADSNLRILQKHIEKEIT